MEGSRGVEKGFMEFLGEPQRPKKSELSGWQLSMRKNFPDKVRKSFSRQKEVRQEVFLRQNKCVHRFRNKKVINCFLRYIKAA